MAVTIAEAIHLVFDRRAVAGPDPADFACEQRRAIEIRANDVVRPLIRAGDGAEELRRGPAFAHRRHGPAAIVRALALESRPVDRAAVEPGRGARLQAGEWQPESAKLGR